MKWFKDFSKIIFESTAYDTDKENIEWLMNYANFDDAKRQVEESAINEDNLKKNLECSLEFKNLKGTYEDYQKLISNTSETSLCCPHCRKFHLVSEYAKPIIGWDEFGKNHATEIVAKLLERYLFNYYSNQKSPKAEIVLSASKKKNPFDITNISFNEFVYEDDELKLTCPDCGNRLMVKTSSWNCTALPGYEVKFLRRDSKWKDYNKFPAYYNIFADDGNPFVSLSIVNFSYFPNPRGKMFLKATNTRITFNTETGMTYRFAERDMDTKKYEYEGPRIMNVTYSDFSYIPADKDLGNEISNEICKKKQIPIIKMEDIHHNALVYNKIRMINRYGQLGSTFISCLLQMEDICGCTTKKMKRDYLKISKDNDMFQKKIKKGLIKGKKRIKLYASNPTLFYMEPIFVLLGFKDNNVLLTLCENADKVVYLACKVKEPNSNYTNFRFNSVKTFIELYVSVKSETELAKKIIADKNRLFIDTCNLFDAISKKIEFSEDYLKRFFTGTISEMHNRACRIDKALKHTPFYIPYSNDDRWVNSKCGEYTFELAKTSNEMREVGDEMKICVGSYASNAASKHCDIVFMRKNGAIQACIEISTDYKLVQAKDFCNNCVEQEKWPALKKFLNENKIDYEGCYDIPEKFYETKEEQHFERIDDKNGYKMFETFEEMKILPLDDFITLDGITIPANNIQNNYFDMPF